jgi:hypothetical protein
LQQGAEQQIHGGDKKNVFEQTVNKFVFAKQVPKARNSVVKNWALAHRTTTANTLVMHFWVKKIHAFLIIIFSYRKAIGLPPLVHATGSVKKSFCVEVEKKKEDDKREEKYLVVNA